MFGKPKFLDFLRSSVSVLIYPRKKHCFPAPQSLCFSIQIPVSYLFDGSKLVRNLIHNQRSFLRSFGFLLKLRNLSLECCQLIVGILADISLLCGGQRIVILAKCFHCFLCSQGVAFVRGWNLRKRIVKYQALSWFRPASQTLPAYRCQYNSADKKSVRCTRLPGSPHPSDMPASAYPHPEALPQMP